MPDKTPLQTSDDIRAQVEALIREEEEMLPQPTATPGVKELTTDFIMDCLACNEVGDGILYAELHRRKFVYVKKNGAWLVWRGHHWDDDVMDEHYRGVEQVALTYLAEADKLTDPLKKQQEKLRKVKQELRDANDRVKEFNRLAKKTANGGDLVALEAVHPEGFAVEEKAKQLETKHQDILNIIGGLTARQKSLHRRVTQLRGTNRATACIKWAHIVENAVAISGDELDQNPHLLPCPNGVIDLRTGELKPGDPADWMVLSAKVDYLGFHHHDPIIDQFMESILPDPDEREFTHQLFGYSISGLTLEQFIAVVLGEGRNGKGLLFEMLEEVLGPFYWTYKSELLLDSNIPQSPAAASPHIMGLRGRRLCAASETDKGKSISASKVKELTGNDTLNARGLFAVKGDTNFRPTHKLFLRTNHLPRGLTEDFALKERLIYLRFPYLFVDDPAEQAEKKPEWAPFFRLKDRELKKKLLNCREAWLSWLVRGFAKWQKAGRLRPPESMKKAVADLQLSEDSIAQFLDACTDTTDRDHETAFGTVYNLFDWWFKENLDDRRGKTPSKRWFSEQLVAKGFRRERSGGQSWFYGIKLTVTQPGTTGWAP